MLPHVAIVGRANVGKSTLFNRITRSRSAIVYDMPGVTRDRMYSQAEWNGKSFMVIDTGGIDLAGDNSIELQVREQGELAIREADVIIFVVDGQQGVLPQDQEVVELLRRSGKPLFLAVNKIDDPVHEVRITDFYELGVRFTIPISSEHDIGISDLMDRVTEKMALPVEEPDIESSETGAIRVAIVGKPNAGKSSIINRLLNSDRCIVSEIPGTTRDTVDLPLEYEGNSFVLMDTAGIRRKGKTRKVVEKFSVIMALKALERCDVAVLVIDGAEGVSEQDATIAGYAFERGKALLLAVNKWDLVMEKELEKDEIETRVRLKLKFVEFAPMIKVSAKSGFGIPNFFGQVRTVFDEFSRKIPTGRLNDCIQRAIQKNPMSTYRGKFLKIYYATQVRSCPPTFECFVNFPEGVHFSYQRYLINSLRKAFGFSGTPVRMLFSSRHQDE
ncbi:GTPase Der [Nitrospina gracilis 3/211]|uniref:GTPase Der n=1 Tax=Nitrospina gracilis (strain 3/211) TaxID=1266370 RepID=M1Z1V1_NITG3|nr:MULTISPECIES: ribosome biogenesis GTPase Der [Nitrospina]MCF8724713.1 GTP-binding protein [Nitrospina sp. Nb-3]CCQ91985.1 GTPase Der [Nitrospina gracilis 3/211]